MSKIVYSACYGGFGLSQEGLRRYAEIKGLEVKERPMEMGGKDFTSVVGPVYTVGGKDYFSARDIERSDPALVQVVEELGAAASSKFSDLKIRELPAGTKYRIDEYDGFESVMTVDEYEWSVA